MDKEDIVEEYDKLEGRELAEYKRMSGRTLEEFKVDIKQAHWDENEIIQRYAVYQKINAGKDIVITDNGVDNSGEFLDVSKVKNHADFIVDGKLIEVKTIKEDLFNFRLKLELLKAYINQEADVLLVLGWETDNPVFTIFNEDDLKHMVTFGRKNISKDWEGKPTVTIYRNSYEWNPLPILN